MKDVLQLELDTHIHRDNSYIVSYPYILAHFQGINVFSERDFVQNMAFTKESSGYEKTILSDLQGAWTLLRESVVATGGFDGMDRVLFHIDEATSWESVRNLGRMPPLLLIIRNLCLQGGRPEEVIENIEQVHDIIHEALLECSPPP